ncbi:MAG TPA: hypothetical protein VJN96_25780 [Vicinamibacterales bacterium]|nr:hypothetical protein [Vicinamibacterales bacterium]
MIDAITSLEQALDLVQVRLEDLSVVLQLTRFDEPGVELLMALVLTRILLARIVIAFKPMGLQQTLAAVGQEHRDIPLAGHSSGIDEAQFAQVPELAVARVERTIVAVAEVLGRDNSEGADGGQGATLRTAQRVLTIAVEDAFALGSARQVELSQEHVTRVRTVALTDVAVSRILVALSRVVNTSRIMVEHGRPLA